MKKISIVIPVYNKELYLGRCIESILQQSYYLIEPIFVDDGSSDGSLSILRKYQKEDNRMVVLHQTNAGVGAARNKGIENASGDYITFVDADDILLPDACLRYMEELENNDCDTVVAQYCIKTESNGVRIPIHFSNSYWTAGKEAVSQYYYIGRNFGTTTCNKLFSMDVINKNHIRFPSLIIGEDTIFNINYVRASSKWRLTNRVVYKYEMNQESAMHKYNDSRIQEIVKLMCAYRENAVQYNDNKDVFKAIDTFCVRDYFTILKFGYSMKENYISRFRWIRKALRNAEYNSKISNANFSMLGKKYKLIYVFIRLRCAALLTVIIGLYYLKYN